MIDYYSVCTESIRQLDELYEISQREISSSIRVVSDLDNIDIASDHPFNFIFPFFYGGASCILSSSETINKFLRKIHDNYAKKNGLLGVLLGHSGDHMDKMPISGGGSGFITRDGIEKIPFGMHRLFWGHDPFSLGPDNPFVLLAKQYGIIRGIIKVFKHLIVDTFSKQGLPIPFHSWFDYTKKVDNVVTTENLLYDFTKWAVHDAGLKENKYSEAFSQMLTVKASDIAATGLNSVLCHIHNTIMNKDNPTVASQVRLIAYSTQFFSKAMYGAIKSGGIPFISWPTAMAVIKEVFVFTKSNLNDLKRLETVTDRLCAKNARLEGAVFGFGALLPSHSNAEGYLAEAQRTERGFNSLMMKFKTNRKN